MAKFTIDSREIHNWKSFHTAFATELKFFDGYGHNMDAWIDCMSDLHGENSLSGYHLPDGEIIELEIKHVDVFIGRCPHILGELIECTAFVNRRYKNCANAAYISLIFIQ